MPCLAILVLTQREAPRSSLAAGAHAGDTGGWKGVLARSKSNALRAWAMEKSRKAKAQVEAAEERRASMAMMQELVKACNDPDVLGALPTASFFANRPECLTLDLKIAKMFQTAASRLLAAHNLVYNLE